MIFPVQPSTTAGGAVRPRRTDANQREIVAALRAVGAEVISLHTVGRGVPDLLVLHRGRVWLLECKSVHGRVEPAQRVFMTRWQGHAHIVHSPEEALQLVTRED